MKLLADTHMLIWAAAGTLSQKAFQYIEDPTNIILFSPVSIWETVIKRSLNRPDFRVDPSALYRGLLANGYIELNVHSRHALAVANLPPIHKDPFDRLLIATALAEGLTLLTADKIISRYGGDIIYIP